MLRRLRWLPAAVLAICCGVLLAVWSQDGGLQGVGGAASPPAAEPEPAPVAAPAQPPGTATSASAPSETPARAEADPAQLERLRLRLIERADEDVDGALQALLALEGQQRLYLAEDVILRAAQAAPEQTVQWLRTHVRDEAKRERLLSAAYVGIAATDPQFALSAAQALSDPELRRVTGHQVVEAWAKQDPVAAYEWVRHQPGGGIDDLQVAVMSAYMESLPDQAGDLIAELPASELQDRLVSQYAQSLAENDAGRALNWLERFDDNVTTRDAVLSVVNRWGRQQPWQAIDYATEYLDGEASFQAVAQIASELGATRPHVLADSLERLPESYRTMTAELLAGSWASNDPQRARSWMESLGSGPVQDAAIRGIAQVAMRESPEQALELARAVSAPPVRESLIRDIEAQRSPSSRDG